MPHSIIDANRPSIKLAILRLTWTSLLHKSPNVCRMFFHCHIENIENLWRPVYCTKV